ncbi:MAG: hypothetical protein HYT83_00865 [Candidatus Levybacteria bacterium]|nr:hypothetical protein [Candidatus Levybacteria bacterium]
MPSQNKKPQFEHLKSKWTVRQKNLQENLWSKHRSSLEEAFSNARQLAVGSLSGFLLLTSPTAYKLPSVPSLLVANQASAKELDKNIFLITDLVKLLPFELRSLTSKEEQTITEILTRSFGVKVKAEIDGKRLNRSYGLIGAEQHLARFPGDNISAHFDSEEESKLYYSSGMAPGLGAWGYFTQSSMEMTEKDRLREKYYIAVQTFLSVDFNKRFAEYRDFFKYRKMIVVNPDNGKAIIAVIGDAGPAVWTGKHLGGSPEIMHYLERFDGSIKGAVLYFFIDDPEDKVPLGPISMK